MALSVGTNSYVSRVDTDTYFADLMHAAVWNAAENEDKEKALVTAWNMMDRQVWGGAKTSAVQVQEHPRTGLTDEYGAAIASDAVHARIIKGQQELALALMQNAAIQTTGSSARDKKAVTAEGVTVEWFGASAAAASGKRFPTIVQEFVGVFLYQPQTASPPTAYGTDNESAFDDDAEKFELSTPYG